MRRGTIQERTQILWTWGLSRRWSQSLYLPWPLLLSLEVRHGRVTELRNLETNQWREPREHKVWTLTTPSMITQIIVTGISMIHLIKDFKLFDCPDQGRWWILKRRKAKRSLRKTTSMSIRHILFICSNLIHKNKCDCYAIINFLSGASTAD